MERPRRMQRVAGGHLVGELTVKCLATEIGDDPGDESGIGDQFATVESRLPARVESRAKVSGRAGPAPELDRVTTCIGIIGNAQRRADGILANLEPQLD